MKIWRKLVFIPLCLGLLLFPTVALADGHVEDEPYKVQVVRKIISTIDVDLADQRISWNREPVEMSNPVLMEDETYFIPLRILAQTAGYDTYLNRDKGKVFITKGTDRIALDLAEDAKLFNGVTYVPINLAEKFPNLGLYTSSKDHVTIFSHGPSLRTNLPDEFFENEITINVDVCRAYQYDLFFNYQPIAVDDNNMVNLKLNRGDNVLSFNFVDRNSQEKTTTKLILDRVHADTKPNYHFSADSIKGLGLELDKSINYFNSCQDTFTIRGNVHATHITIGVSPLDSKNTADQGAVERDPEGFNSDSRDDLGQEQKFKVIPNEKFDFNLRLDLDPGLYKITIYQPYVENSKLLTGDRLAHFYLQVK